MRHSSENALNALAAWLLCITGTSLVLIPFDFNVSGWNIPYWGLSILGILSYLVSLFNQLLFVSKHSERRARVLHGMSALFMFGATLFFFQAGYFIEGFIFGFTAIMQLTLLTPLKERLAHVDLLWLTFVLTGFSSGIYLAASGGEYTQFNIGSSKNILAGLFLITALFEMSRVKFFPERIGAILSRIQVVPWVGWCLVFLPKMSVSHLAAPGLFIVMILLNDFFPWERLRLPDNDILGNRAVKITSTLGTTLLIFLWALLTVMDLRLTNEVAALITTRSAAFLFFALILAILYYELVTIIMTVNGLMNELARTDEDTDQPAETGLLLWNARLLRYIKPFTRTREALQIRLSAQSDQINTLTHQLVNEKNRNAQVSLLIELSQQLENQLDQPVAAQLTVNSIERALHCDLACLFIHEPDQKGFMLLAAAGKHINLIPPGFRQGISEGVLGRAIRQRKTQVVSDIRLDADYIHFEDEPSLSAVVIPLIFNGYVNGAISLSSDTVNAFKSSDIWLAEMAAAELVRAWERSRYHQRLMTMVQTGSQLSAMVQPETTISEVASISREILQARFTYVQIHLGQEQNSTQSASSGKAPHLLKSLETSKSSEALIQMGFQAVQPFRVRDIRKYPPTSHLVIDHAGLRSMLAIPIRWHRLSIGTILAFGKQNEVFFNENDQSLAELLSIQAGGSFESTWLQQELRGSLRTTSLLYRLSTQIIQSDNLQDTALDIVQTAYKIGKSATTGILLFDKDGNTVAEAQIDASGVHTGREHPAEIIKDAMASGQPIFMSQGNSMMRACLPIQTSILKYGILWMDIPEDQVHKSTSNPNDLQALVNQTAIALERSVLLVESRRQAAEIKAAYDKLEATYDQTLAALMSALDARDRETEGHSSRVSRLTARMGKALNFSREQLKVLERGSLLHDIGKIGISDTILHKPGRLSEEEWTVMRRHPDIGAKIVNGIPFLEETIPLIRHHQERWDGTGYPGGLRGEEIPILARMFSIADAFDALTSNRPYRQKISEEEAVQYLREQSGTLFDPHIVEIFEQVLKEQSGETTLEQHEE